MYPYKWLLLTWAQTANWFVAILAVGPLPTSSGLCTSRILRREWSEDTSLWLPLQGSVSSGRSLTTTTAISRDQDHGISSSLDWKIVFPPWGLRVGLYIHPPSCELQNAGPWHGHSPRIGLVWPMKCGLFFFFWMSCQYLKMRDSSTSLDFWFFSWKMGLSDNFGLDFSQGNSWLEPSSGYSLWAAKASLPSFTSFMLLFWPHRHFQFGAPDPRLFTPSPAYLSPTSHRSGCPPLPLSLFVYLNTFHFVSQRTWSWLYEINIIK